MSETEMIKEQLKSASEWFTEHGRNTNTAIIGICDRAYETINSQQAEIENLKEKNKINAECAARQYKEIERLQKLLDDKCDRCIARDRAEAIKEFAYKLQERCNN